MGESQQIYRRRVTLTYLPIQSRYMFNLLIVVRLEQAVLTWREENTSNNGIILTLLNIIKQIIS